MNVSVIVPADVAAVLTPAGWLEPRPGTLRDQVVSWWVDDHTGHGVSQLPSIVFEDADGNTVVVPKSTIFGVRLAGELLEPPSPTEHGVPLGAASVGMDSTPEDAGEVLGLRRGVRFR
jgi:hypothetical protein